MSTFSRSATSAALRSGRTLKPMMIAFDAVASSTSDSLMAPTRRVDDLDLRLVVRQLAERVGQHFGRALHVGLDDDRQLLDVALRQLLLQRFERQAAALGAERALLGLRLPEGRDLPRLRRIGHRLERVAGRRQVSRGRALRPASTGRPPSARRPRSSMSARTRPTTGPAMMLSPTRSEPSCTSTVATGPRPRSSLVSSTVPIAARFGLALCSPMSVTSRIISSSRSRPGLLLRRDLDEDRRAAPLFGHQVEVGELPLHRLRIRARLVDLVDGDDDRHVRRARVIDRFPRLRHHAVVGRDDENDDVGDLRAAGAHQRERFVTRRVEEDDVLVVLRRRPARDTRRCAA